jgi:hypothetical protein
VFSPAVGKAPTVLGIAVAAAAANIADIPVEAELFAAASAVASLPNKLTRCTGGCDGGSDSGGSCEEEAPLLTEPNIAVTEVVEDVSIEPNPDKFLPNEELNAMPGTSPPVTIGEGGGFLLGETLEAPLALLFGLYSGKILIVGTDAAGVDALLLSLLGLPAASSSRGNRADSTRSILPAAGTSTEGLLASIKFTAGAATTPTESVNTLKPLLLGATLLFSSINSSLLLLAATSVTRFCINTALGATDAGAATTWFELDLLSLLLTFMSVVIKFSAYFLRITKSSCATEVWSLA